MWLSFGARWDISQAHRVDLAYAHVFFQESQINRTSGGMTLQGDYTNSADILSAQYTFSF
jgi:long-chain fatty acid transport protein